MALKDTWIDKVDGVDDVEAKTTNEIAHAVIEIEKKMEKFVDVSEVGQ